MVDVAYTKDRRYVNGCHVGRKKNTSSSMIERASERAKARGR
jgi:hypothetical protein